MESACVSNERKILAGVKSSPLTDVFGALRLPLVPHVQTGSFYRWMQLSVMGCMPTTLSQDVRPEVPHHPWRAITEQGLQDAGPLSMMDKLEDCQIWSYKDARHRNTEVQQRGVPTTSHRTEELMQYMESCPQRPIKNCNL